MLIFYLHIGYCNPSNMATTSGLLNCLHCSDATVIDRIFLPVSMVQMLMPSQGREKAAGNNRHRLCLSRHLFAGDNNAYANN